MPEVIVPIIAAIGSGIGMAAIPGTVLADVGTGLAIGGTAAGVGETLANLPGGGQTPTTPSTTPTPSTGMSPSDMAAAVEAIRKSFPDLQLSTGGALGPQSIGAVGGTEAGYGADPSAIQQALSSFLGQGNQPAGTTGTPSVASPTGTPDGTFNIQKILKGLNMNRPGFTLQNPF